MMTPIQELYELRKQKKAQMLEANGKLSEEITLEQLIEKPKVEDIKPDISAELTAKNGELTATIEKLNAELAKFAEISAANEELKQKLSVLEAEKTNFESDRASFNSQIEAVNLQLSATNKECETLKGEIATLRQIHATKEVKHLVVSDGSATGQTSIYEQYKAIKDPKQRALFYREHREEINAYNGS